MRLWRTVSEKFPEKFKGDHMPPYPYEGLTGIRGRAERIEVRGFFSPVLRRGHDFFRPVF